MKQIIILVINVCFISLLHGQVASQKCHFNIDPTGKKVYTNPDSSPEPKKGMAELYKTLLAQVRYPASREDSPPFNTTVIRFLVDEEGKVRNKEVVSETIKGLGIAEQMFVIIESMEWIPGKCNNERVAVELMIPLKVRFQ